MKRQRGRNRKPGGGAGGGNNNNANPNRSWDSQGPENIKVRGNAQTVYERYLQLARDATAAGDRVLGENYMQHAEHYFRVLRALQPSRPVSEIAARELSNQGFDIDFEDESGAQAAAIMAAHAAEQARLNPQGQPQGDGEGQAREYQNRDGQQPREWRDRNENRDRPENRERNNDPRDRDRAPREDREPRADNEQPRADGQPRETRRERWERRNAERDARRLAEGGEGAEARAESPTDAPVEAAPQPSEARPARKPRAERAPRESVRDQDDAPSALPGFLTRSAAPAAAAEAEAAPKPRRAPRKKAEAVED